MLRRLACLLALALLGCGSAMLDAAKSGDLDAFRSRLDERLKAGEVDVDEAREVAERLISHQIATARGPSGERSLEGVSECPRAFDKALAQRAEHDDELAAQAAMLRVEAGLVAPMHYAHRLDSDAPGWRAVAVRTLTLPAPDARASGAGAEQRRRAARWRRKLTEDPSAEVRRAALRAAYDAADLGDAEAVLEAARLDPDPRARLIAVEAAGAIGTRKLVLGLKDLWAPASEELRLAIVGAWAHAWRRPYRERGQRLACGQNGALDDHPSCLAYHQLARISELGKGLPTVMAAHELLHGVAPEHAPTPASAGAVEANAAAVLERFIDESATRVRAEAIASAPLSWAHLVEAIVEAAKSDDERVAVAALARLAELEGDEAERARVRLRKVAAGDGAGAESARRALVELRDAPSAELLARDARAKSAESRGRAASGYAALGSVAEAMRLLADQDASVRGRAGCAILQMD